MDTIKITVQAIVLANTKKVWEYYTNPNYITQWNFADPSWHCPSAENDLRIGGKCSARVEAKDGSFGFDFVTVYTDLVIEEKIEYVMEDGREAIVTFKNLGDQTEVVIVFDAETQNPVELQQGGWKSILNSFKQYTETH